MPKKPTNNPPRNIPTGVSWYLREDYEKLKQILKDGADLPANYDDWQSNADKRIAELAKVGVRVVKINIDPEAFSAWCKANNKELDSPARAAFAAYSIGKRYENN